MVIVSEEELNLHSQYEIDGYVGSDVLYYGKDKRKEALIKENFYHAVEIKDLEKLDTAKFSLSYTEISKGRMPGEQ